MATTTKKKGRPKKESSESVIMQRCPCCGRELEVNKNNFYKSYSELYKNSIDGRMVICKDCVANLCDYYKEKFQSELRAVYYLCQLLDVYFNKKLYTGACNQIQKQKEQGQNKGDVYLTYFQKVVSLPQYKGKTFIDSDSLEEKDLQHEDEITLGLNKETMKFWGKGRTKDEYEFLEDEYGEMVSVYGDDSYALKTIFREIAETKLDIDKKRRKGQSVKDEQKALTDLFTKAGISPNQESENMNNDAVTFGTMIKKFENEEPIPEPLPEWKKKDWIHYMMVWFLGNLCRMMGKPNPFQDEFDKEMEKYSVIVDEEDE